MTRDQVIELVQQRYPVKRELILSPTRGRPDASWARQLSMYLLKKLTPDVTPNLSVVAQAFGRDRTTVRHAYTRVEARRKDDAELEAWIKGLLKQASQA